MIKMKNLELGHIGIHEKANLNSGDTLLFQVVRDLFEKALEVSIHWNLYQVWEEFDKDKIDQINSTNDAVILGGGGLLLRDQLGSDIKNSGWQWNCSANNTLKFNLPLIIYAIGYNRFYNQEDFSQEFTASMNAIAEKSPFFSLRNNGSLNAVRRYLSKENLETVKLFRQFCPTTIVSRLYPDLNEIALEHEKKGRRLLSFNAAFDRAEMRFTDPVKKFNEICTLMKYAQDKGWTIIACAHKDMDREIEKYLERNNVKFIVKDLTRSSPDEIMRHYAQVDLSVGMRGHSQMIPFGFNKPIFSLISHDKLKFFLEDLNLNSLGVDLNSKDLIDIFSTFLENFDKNELDLIQTLKEKQNFIWKETSKNFSIIRSQLQLC